MRRVIFSGTSEGKTLCRQLSQASLSAEVCVATEYGKEVMPELNGITVHTGRMTAPEMTEFLCGAQVVIDATHPYAVEVSKNIRAACATGIVPIHSAAAPQDAGGGRRACAVRRGGGAVFV